MVEIPKPRKLSEIHKAELLDAIKVFISDFWYQKLREHFLYEDMEDNKNIPQKRIGE